MPLSRTGGVLLIAGAVAAGAWVLVFGRPAGPDEARAGSWLVNAATALIGAGAAAVAIAAARPLHSKPARLGLGLATIGLVGIAASQTVVVIPAGTDVLESWLFVGLVAGGFVCAMIGVVLVGAALARSSDLSGRLVGLALLAGPLSLPIAAAFSLAFHADARGVVMVGLGVSVLSVAGVGVLALGVGRVPPAG